MCADQIAMPDHSVPTVTVGMHLRGRAWTRWTSTCVIIVRTHAQALVREEPRNLALVHAAADGGNAGAKVDVTCHQTGILQDIERHLVRTPAPYL